MGGQHVNNIYITHPRPSTGNDWQKLPTFTHLIAVTLCGGLLQLFGTSLPLKVNIFFSLKWCLANSEMIRERALNLWEVHGISGPVVHQFVEVIGKGSFPLVGGWHVRGQTLGTPLALTQTRTTHRVCAIRPCRRRRGRGGKETQLRIFVFRIHFDKCSEWMRMMFLFWPLQGLLQGDSSWSLKAGQNVVMGRKSYR